MIKWILYLSLLAVQMVAGFGIYYGLQGIDSDKAIYYIVMLIGSIFIFGFATITWFWIGLVNTVIGRFIP